MQEEDASRQTSSHYNGRNGQNNLQNEPEIEAQVGEEGAEETEEAGPDESLLPPNGLIKALLAGVIGGIVGIAIQVILTLLNASAFLQAASNKSQNPSGADYLVVGLACLNFLVAIVLCLGTGFVVGKIAVQRRSGFYAGALVAAIIYLASVVVNYIPNYPGHSTTNQAASVGAFSGGILISLVFLLVWMLLGGLFGLWGTRLATRNHPYYQR